MDAGAIVFLWVLCGVVGAAITSSRGAGGWSGFFLGLFLGPLGVLLSLFMQPGEKSVPVSPPGSTADELAKFAALHDAGRMSDQEYDAVKRRLLS